MNETTTKEFALVTTTGTDLAKIVADETQTENILHQIETEVRAQKFDVTSAKDRKAARSLAAKVARSKTALDEAGKELNAGKRAEIEAVDAQRRVIRERLDALRDEVREPVAKWEADEEKRKAAHEAVLATLREPGVDYMSTAATIRGRKTDLMQIDISGLQEYQEQANLVRLATLEQLDGFLTAALDREEKEAELARLRAAEEQRQREEQARREREAEEKRQAEERARMEREEREAEERRKAEAERREREREEAAERARAEAKADADRQIAEANERAERARQEERARIAEEQRRADEQRRKREQDEAHRAKVLYDINAALGPIPREQIAQALLDGRVPHVKVML